MILRRTSTKGFTAVELLITLFVAAAFLTIGYQLFAIIMQDGGEARAESSASNVAYDYMRRYADSATNPCIPSTPLSSSAVTIEGILSPKISIAISCPQTDTPTLSKIEAFVSYQVGSKTSTVKYATFVDKSKGAPPATDITNGLISWWKLNGNTSNAAGSPALYNEGVPTIAGQDGNPVGAYSFSAASQKALRAAGFSDKLAPLNNFTVTGWVYPSSNPTTHEGFFGIRDPNLPTGGVWALQLQGTNSLECRIQIGGNAYEPAKPTLLPGQWQLLSIVYSNGTLRCYVNSSASAVVSNVPWSQFTGSNLDFTIGTTATLYATARIDDVRVYGRALSATEIEQLRTNGAR